MTRGFMLGKFMPPTLGHGYLGDFASAYCDDLTIMVESHDGQPVPGNLRYQWMKEMFPNANVIWCHEKLPQDPSETDEFWDIWRDALSRHAPGEYDFVFASEYYGLKLAEVMGARFVPVDISRDCRNISGTEMRSNPFKHWEFLPNVVRPYYAKRITLFGPESTGKSTVGRRLAKHYNTVLIPEYGRVHVDAFGSDVTTADLDLITAGHQASVAAATRHCNRIMIEDTDPVMTTIWSEILHGTRDGKYADMVDNSDLYLLCDVDIPWVDDGQRYFPDHEDRKRFFNLCRKELEDRKAPYVVLRGDLKHRISTACQAIDTHILDA